MPFTSSGEVWIFCIVTIHPPRVPNTGKALSFPPHNPSTKGSSHSHPRPPRHNKINMDVFDVWSFLQKDKFRPAVGGDDDFRYLLEGISSVSTDDSQILLQKARSWPFSSELQKRGSYLLWAYKPTIIWKTTQDTKLSGAIAMV